MNIEQANRLDLPAILKQVGYLPVKQNGHELWYLSPLRKEKTPSFHVHVKKNIWYDFGEAEGGNVIGFVCAYLRSRNEDYTAVDALRWLKNMQPCNPVPSVAKGTPDDYEAALQLKKISGLQNPAFIHYLHSRGIPLMIAQKYLKEAQILNRKTQKSFLAMGLQNENGGYELRNKFFKGTVGAKGISIIRGTVMLPDEVHLFEGIMDFVSALIHQKKSRFDGDVIILNSVSCLSHVFPYLDNYSYKTIYTWLDNDVAGAKATQRMREYAEKTEQLAFKSMNKTYAGHKDVNAWHMHILGLKP